MKKLRYTAAAKEKYDNLTGSQRKFVDEGLDQLKKAELISQEIENKELGLTISCEQNGDEVLIKDIAYRNYRKTDNYQDAQQRMNDWNN